MSDTSRGGWDFSDQGAAPAGGLDRLLGDGAVSEPTATYGAARPGRRR